MKKIFMLGLLFTLFSAVAFSQQATQRTNQQTGVKKVQATNTIQQKPVKTNKVISLAERKRLQQRRIDKKKEMLRSAANRPRSGTQR